MSLDIVDEARLEANEITCYASTVTEYRPNRTAKVLQKAADEIASLRAQLEDVTQLKDDAVDDVKRLHNEKMKFFERTIELESQLAAANERAELAVQVSGKGAAVQLFNDCGERLKQADDVLRSLSSWLGQGGMWDTENLNYAEVEKRIRKGVDSHCKVQAELAAAMAVRECVANIGTWRNEANSYIIGRMQEVLSGISSPATLAKLDELVRDGERYKLPSSGYYLQDSRTFVGNDMMWWAKDGRGYTTDLRKAHVFTDAEFAKGASRETDVFWPVQYINGISRPVADFQYASLDAARRQACLTLRLLCGAPRKWAGW